MTINLHDPIQIGTVQLKNRMIMAPMQQNQGTPDSYATDYHVKFYSERAEHVSLIIIESTVVCPQMAVCSRMISGYIPNSIRLHYAGLSMTSIQKERQSSSN